MEKQEGVHNSVVKGLHAVDEDGVIMVQMENAKMLRSHVKAITAAQKSVSSDVRTTLLQRYFNV